MLELYIKESCPFCEKVLDYADEKDIEITLLDIADETVLEDLVRRGGRRQVPYLVDTNRGEEMYESDDIIEYLSDYYA